MLCHEWCFCLLLAATAVASQEPGIQLKDGDVVALVGGSFLERDRHYGQFETMLRTRFPGVAFRVCNLARSGDGFPRSEQDRQTLAFELQQFKPTLIFVSCAVPFTEEGDTGVETTLTHFRRLLEQSRQTQAKLIVLSPIRRENLGALLPDPSAHNEVARLYGDALRKIAAAESCIFINLFNTVVRPGSNIPMRPLTENGLHLTEQGYEVAAEAMARQFRLGTSLLNAEQREFVRKLVVRKEQLFSARWRPCNAVWFGTAYSKKNNQGKHPLPTAQETTELDRLLKETEDKIVDPSRLPN